MSPFGFGSNGSPSDRPPAMNNEIVDLVDGVVHNRISRGQFMRRGLALGLGAAALEAVLAGSASASPAAEGAAGISEAPGLAAIRKIVYPAGVASVNELHGPYGKTKAAALPATYHGPIGKNKIWQWKFANFKADKPYKLAHAAFSSKWDTGSEISARAKLIAKQMGCTLDVFDNNFDGDTAIKNTDLIIARKYDYALIGQIYPDVNKAIYKKLTAAGIKCGFIAVEAAGTPKSVFADPGNYRQFYGLGVRLGNYAKSTWQGQVDLVILGAQPRAGKYVGEREVGFKAGLKSVLPNVPDSAFETIDTQGVLATAQTAAAALLTTKPDAKYIIGSGTNDDTGVGLMNAIAAAGKSDTAAVCGQGGQASAVTELKKPSSVFKVSGFNDLTTYAWLLSIGVYTLMGGTPALVNEMPNYYVTKDNIAAFPPQVGVVS